MKNDPFVVAEALSNAAQQHPFSNLIGVVWTIRWLCDNMMTDGTGRYFRLLIKIGNACNVSKEKQPPSYSLADWQKAANRKCEENQVYILERIPEHSTSSLSIDETMLMLWFQVSMCLGPHKRTRHKAKGLLKKVGGYLMGRYSNPALSVEGLNSFLGDLVKKAQDAESGSEKERLIEAVDAVCYGIFGAAGINTVAFKILEEWEKSQTKK
ncbi:MAG: hypothetical protein HQ539_01930 [Parcubacteria group bacterium]|nr:hypothetical protein [Parcubacteria group bacterium]